MRHRAAWLSVVAYAVVSFALLTVAGCVNAQPFEPEMCVIRADSLTVWISQRTLQLCARPLIQTEIQKP